ncbi:hypothetical protein K501DRAFT_331044 [Backusella circina FSU 941]|nr:hypothetical protein K501DRAFT_331044 [Backusella circina FSU 941]
MPKSIKQKRTVTISLNFILQSPRSLTWKEELPQTQKDVQAILQSLLKNRWRALTSKDEKKAFERREQVEAQMIEEDGDDYTSGDIRTCTATMNKIAKNIKMKKHVQTVLNDAITEASNYIIEYSVLVRSMMLLFTDATFVIESNAVSFVKRLGFKIAEILPPGFQIETKTVYVAPPLYQDVLDSKDYDEDISKLFKGSHLDFIHASYFGNKGMTEASLAKNPCHKPLCENLSKNQHTPSCNTTLMNSSGKINKLLNNLLETLLKINLASKREHKYKQYIKEREKNKKKSHSNDSVSVPIEAISVIGKSRDGKRRLFRNEIKKAEHYGRKSDQAQRDAEAEYYLLLTLQAEEEKAQRCYERVDTYDKALKREKNEKVSTVEQQIADKKQDEYPEVELEILTEDNTKAAQLFSTFDEEQARSLSRTRI